MDQNKAFESLLKLNFGLLGSVCLYAVVKLRVADYIADGMTKNEDIAIKVGLAPQTLYRIMRLLCSQDVFREQTHAEYALTQLSQLLRSDQVGSIAPYIETVTESCIDVLPSFLPALQQRAVPMEYRYGKPAFDWITETTERAELWQQAFASEHWPETEAMMNAYDFSRTQVLADIGGGHGEVVISFLNRHKSARAVIFDVPLVLEQTRKKFDELGLSSRCEFVSGDFFESVPVKADTYLLRHILHDWDNEQCQTILSNIADSAESGSRLIIAESVLKDTNEPDIGKLLDIEMLWAVTGMERTKEEFRSLFDMTGIEFSGVIPTESVISVVEGRISQ